jgi:hypothetical protein
MKYSKEQLYIGTEFIGADDRTYRIIDICNNVNGLKTLCLEDNLTGTFNINNLLNTFENGKRKLLTSNQIVYQIF